MLKKIVIEDFRSIKEQAVEIAPITVLYGPNGAGKSSLLYALAVFRNIILNPNQSVDSFFNLGFANFGGFKQVIFKHKDKERAVLFGIETSKDDTMLNYSVTVDEDRGWFSINGEKPYSLSKEIFTPFPYQGQREENIIITEGETSYNAAWNGIIVSQVSPRSEKGRSKRPTEKSREIQEHLNNPIETLRRMEFVNLKRGFSKPHYSTVPLSPNIVTEDEVATLLANDKYLSGRISALLEEMLDRQFRVNTTPGTAMFSLDSLQKSTGLTTELVNDGFGVNQVVYLLAKCLPQDVETVCIEEPEIHLHPTALRKLAQILVNLHKEESKTFIISTHSEQFLLAFLSSVAKNRLQPDQLACYLCLKKEGESHFERQSVNKNGQIEGGLATFLEGELEDIREFLGVEE